MKWVLVLTIVIIGIFTGNSNQHELGLVAQIVPLVVNPSENLEPPTFAAAIFNKDQLIGAGAIVAKNYVLTLCSILQTAGGEKVSPNEIKVSHPVFKGRELKSVQNTSATNIEVHPQCGGRNVHVGKDIALIHTKEEMKNVAYPKLSTEHVDEGNKGRFMISTFRVFNHAASDTMTAIWYIITRKVDNSFCEMLFKADKEKFNAKDNFCMSYFHMGDASYCKGDFGSPLSLRYNNKDTLVGLNLHKHKCGQPREAASFVSIPNSLDWIKETMKQ